MQGMSFGDVPHILDVEELVERPKHKSQLAKIVKALL